MSNDPNAVARESYAFWSPLVRWPVHWQALLGNEARETSFNPKAIGDHGEAIGPAQWHPARRAFILDHFKIDVSACSHLDQLRAWHLEMTEPVSPYRHVWLHLQAEPTLYGACRVLVHEFEGSANQGRNITRQVALAQRWAATLTA